MREGHCGIGPLDVQDIDRLSVKIGGQVRGYDETRISTGNRSRSMTGLRSSRLAARRRLSNRGWTFSGELANRDLASFWAPRAAG